MNNLIDFKSTKHPCECIDAVKNKGKNYDSDDTDDENDPLEFVNVLPKINTSEFNDLLELIDFPLKNLDYFIKFFDYETIQLVNPLLNPVEFFISSNHQIKFLYTLPYSYLPLMAKPKNQWKLHHLQHERNEKIANEIISKKGGKNISALGSKIVKPSDNKSDMLSLFIKGIVMKEIDEKSENKEGKSESGLQHSKVNNSQLNAQGEVISKNMENKNPNTNLEEFKKEKDNDNDVHICAPSYLNEKEIDYLTKACKVTYINYSITKEGLTYQYDPTLSEPRDLNSLYILNQRFLYEKICNYRLVVSQKDTKNIFQENLEIPLKTREARPFLRRLLDFFSFWEPCLEMLVSHLDEEQIILRKLNLLLATGFHKVLACQGIPFNPLIGETCELKKNQMYVFAEVKQIHPRVKIAYNLRWRNRVVKLDGTMEFYYEYHEPIDEIVIQLSGVHVLKFMIDYENLKPVYQTYTFNLPLKYSVRGVVDDIPTIGNYRAASVDSFVFIRGLNHSSVVIYNSVRNNSAFWAFYSMITKDIANFSEILDNNHSFCGIIIHNLGISLESIKGTEEHVKFLYTKKTKLDKPGFDDNERMEVFKQKTKTIKKSDLLKEDENLSPLDLRKKSGRSPSEDFDLEKDEKGTRSSLNKRHSDEDNGVYKNKDNKKGRGSKIGKKSITTDNRKGSALLVGKDDNFLVINELDEEHQDDDDEFNKKNDGKLKLFTKGTKKAETEEDESTDGLKLSDKDGSNTKSSNKNNEESSKTKSKKVKDSSKSSSSQQDNEQDDILLSTKKKDSDDENKSNQSSEDGYLTNKTDDGKEKLKIKNNEKSKHKKNENSTSSKQKTKLAQNTESSNDSIIPEVYEESKESNTESNEKFSKKNNEKDKLHLYDDNKENSLIETESSKKAKKKSKKQKENKSVYTDTSTDQNNEKDNFIKIPNKKAKKEKQGKQDIDDEDSIKLYKGKGGKSSSNDHSEDKDSNSSKDHQFNFHSDESRKNSEINQTEKSNFSENHKPKLKVNKKNRKDEQELKGEDDDNDDEDNQLVLYNDKEKSTKKRIIRGKSKKDKTKKGHLKFNVDENENQEENDTQLDQSNLKSKNTETNKSDDENHLDSEQQRLEDEIRGNLDDVQFFCPPTKVAFINYFDYFRSEEYMRRFQKLVNLIHFLIKKKRLFIIFSLNFVYKIIIGSYLLLNFFEMKYSVDNEIIPVYLKLDLNIIDHKPSTFYNLKDKFVMYCEDVEFFEKHKDLYNGGKFWDPVYIPLPTDGIYREDFIWYFRYTLAKMVKPNKKAERMMITEFLRHSFINAEYWNEIIEAYVYKYTQTLDSELKAL